MLKQFLTLTVAAAMIAPAFAAQWMDDFAAAKSKAKTENKLVLMDFTGSDWCGWCMKLRKEVLDKPAFTAYAKKKFVLMEVDCPRKKKLSDKLMKQNQQLCNQYNISGFPTVLVVNAEGVVVGGFSGYKKQDELEATLNKAIKADADIRAAKKLPAEKQKEALEAVYQTMEPAARNAGGYKLNKEVASADQRKELSDKLNACTTTEEQLQVLAEAEPTILASNKHFFLDRKFTVMVNAAETTEDLEAAHKVGDELVASLPEPYASHIKKQVDAIFVDPAAFLEKMKAARAAEAAQAPEAK